MVRFQILISFVLILILVTKCQMIGEYGEESEDESEDELEDDDDSEHFNCDLVLSDEQERSLYSPEGDGESRAVSIWPKNKDGHVVVPYRMSKHSGFCE